jgi:hypothetical protein
MMKARKSKTTRTKANIVRLQPKAMSSEALVLHIQNETVGVLRRISELRPFYVELWARFERLPMSGKIMGCSTRTEFARDVLHRSMKSIQYALYGRNGHALYERGGLPDVIDRMKYEEEEREDARLGKEAKQEEQEEQEERDGTRRKEAVAKKYEALKAKPPDQLTDQDHAFNERIGKQKAEETARDAQRKAQQEEWDRQRASEPTTSTVDTPPAEDLREFASLGRRAAGVKYHPDRAGENQRIRELNQVADWLETVASQEL